MAEGHGGFDEMHLTLRPRCLKAPSVYIVYSPFIDPKRKDTGVSKIRGACLGVLIIGIITYLGPYWGS